jgi:ubiquinone/menaquinone biosynthesis C-methylase UbiE
MVVVIYLSINFMSNGSKYNKQLSWQKHMEPKKPNSFRSQQLKNTEEKGWDEVAQWYDELVGNKGSDYHKNVIVPAVIEMLEIRRGEKVLDLCCGQGFFGNLLLEVGAAYVCGVDASEKLIETAIARAAGDPRLEYILADACKSGSWADHSFGKIACILAVHDLPNIKGFLANVKSSLSKNGFAIIVFMHPCFRIPQHSHWEWDQGKKVQYRRIDSYGKSREIFITTHPGKEKSQSTIFYHRPLAEYLTDIGAAGLAVIGCKELFSHRKSQAGPRSVAEHRAAEEFPLFMVLKVVAI